jgi:hypothetical protein
MAEHGDTTALGRWGRAVLDTVLADHQRSG